MDNEETKILNQTEEKKDNVQTSKKATIGKNAAYAGGGFVAGVAAGYAGSAQASEPAENVTLEAATTEVEPTTNETESANASQVEALASTTNTTTQTASNLVVTEPVDAPNPEEVLLATDEGIRVAQVSDNASFAEAFADARAQVGAGGTFEWKGNVYSTYTEEEWNNMSASERAQFQSKVDYQSIAGESNEVKPTPAPTPTAVQEPANVGEEATPANAEMVDDQSGNNGIKVLGVETVVDSEGNPVTLAAVELEGEQALLVDVDNNGIMDVMIVDENGDGQITENELFDVSEGNIATNDLQQMAAMQNDDMLYACNDDMPDYMNDADISSMA